MEKMEGTESHIRTTHRTGGEFVKNAQKKCPEKGHPQD